jgi:4-hydroxy-3-methylbut-2-enyl diphosphate reductase
VLGQIVHNRHVVDDLAQHGIISLDGPDRLALLDQVQSGTVIFTAHGVAPAVKQAAAARGLNCVDATCPDVTVTHDLVKRLVAALDLAHVQKLALTTQTTLSTWDTAELIDLVRQKYPHVEIHNDICMATQLRQEAVVTQTGDADVVLVVGDTRSNNSNRLVQVANERAGRRAYLVDSVRDIDPAWLRGARKIAVTAGSSTPSELTREVIRHVETLPREP